MIYYFEIHNVILGILSGGVNVKKVRIKIKHKGCFTQLQNSSDLRVLDISLAKPQEVREKIKLFPGYLSLRGPVNEKKKFYEACQSHTLGTVVFVSESSRLITSFDSEPTIFHYETAEVGKPGVLSVIDSSGLNHPWPLIINVRDGQEELLIQDTDESIQKFREDFEKEGIGEIDVDDKISESTFEEERRSFDIDKEIVCGLHFFITLKESLKLNVAGHRYAKFLKEILINPEKNLKDLCTNYGLSYGTGRQMAGKAKRGIEETLKDLYQIILSDLSNNEYNK